MYYQLAGRCPCCCTSWPPTRWLPPPDQDAVRFVPLTRVCVLAFHIWVLPACPGRTGGCRTTRYPGCRAATGRTACRRSALRCHGGLGGEHRRVVRPQPVRPVIAARRCPDLEVHPEIRGARALGRHAHRRVGARDAEGALERGGGGWAGRRRALVRISEKRPARDAGRVRITEPNWLLVSGKLLLNPVTAW